MFDDGFSFDAAAHSPSLASLSSTTTLQSPRSTSPCNTLLSEPCPAPQISVADLAAHFAQQRLHREAHIRYDSCDSYAADDDDADWVIPPLDGCDSSPLRRARLLIPSRPSSPPRRDQRQANTRLLCSAAHRQDIAALVARMVDAREQCCISPLEPDTPASYTEDDEGYNSGSDGAVSVTTSRRSSATASPFARIGHRRASDLVTGGACVSKSIRLRKDRRHNRVRSSETSS